MAEHSKIEWTDATWNPVTGCSVLSPGCTNCYAMGLAGTRLAQHPSRAGLTTASGDFVCRPLTGGELFVVAAHDFADAFELVGELPESLAAPQETAA